MATAMRLDPNTAGYRYQNATFLSGTGQAHRALLEFAAALQLDPNLVGPQYGMAFEYARLGRPGQAIQAYEAYLALDGTSERAQRARQELMRLRGQSAVPDPTGRPPGGMLSCPPDSVATASGCVRMVPQ